MLLLELLRREVVEGTLVEGTLVEGTLEAQRLPRVNDDDGGKKAASKAASLLRTLLLHRTVQTLVLIMKGEARPMRQRHRKAVKREDVIL